MQPTPPRQEFGCRRGPSVQAGIEKLLVGRQEDHESERNNGAEEHRGDQHSAIAAASPRRYAESTPSERERRLHHGAATVARPELLDRKLCSAAESSGMLNQVDVDRGATEEAGADGGKERDHWTVVEIGRASCR